MQVVKLHLTGLRLRGARLDSTSMSRTAPANFTRFGEGSSQAGSDVRERRLPRLPISATISARKQRWKNGVVRNLAGSSRSGLLEVKQDITLKRWKQKHERSRNGSAQWSGGLVVREPGRDLSLQTHRSAARDRTTIFRQEGRLYRSCPAPEICVFVAAPPFSTKH